MGRMYMCETHSYGGNLPCPLCAQPVHVPYIPYQQNILPDPRISEFEDLFNQIKDRHKPYCYICKRYVEDVENGKVIYPGMSHAEDCLLKKCP
jgi:hypothetical protein